jgi:ACT domain-containing protein
LGTLGQEQHGLQASAGYVCGLLRDSSRELGKDERNPMADPKTSQICIITVTGADRVGIVARLATAMAKANVNIVDINQKIMEDYFVMTMAVDVAQASVDMGQIKRRLDQVGRQMALKITIQDENIFKAMHRV